MILDTAVRREPLVGHDGRSGARLERVVLADGRRLVVKPSTPAHDLAMRATGDTTGRERVLWAAGVLDRLPVGVGHAIVDAWLEGDQVVTVMRDLRDAVLGWRRISRAECRHLFAAMTAIHEVFAGEPAVHACSLADHLRLLSPAWIRRQRRPGDLLPPLVLRGWDRFGDTAPADVVEAVRAIHDDPGLLAGPLARRPATLIHGDLSLTNAAFEADQVTLLDWGLATWAPPALELAPFLATCWSSVDASREEIIDDFRVACGERHDPAALRLSLLAGLVELGWNKALDITEHPDPEIRVREQADLDWWVTQAFETLESGLL